MTFVKSSQLVQIQYNWEKGRKEAERKFPYLIDFLRKMARPEGLEPPTSWFVARCSDPTELRAQGRLIIM